MIRIIICFVACLIMGCDKVIVTLHSNDSMQNYSVNYKEGFILRESNRYKVVLRFEKTSKPFITDTEERISIYISGDETLTDFQVFFIRIQARAVYGTAKVTDFSFQDKESKTPIVKFKLNAEGKDFQPQIFDKISFIVKGVPLQWVNTKEELMKGDSQFENEIKTKNRITW